MSLEEKFDSAKDQVAGKAKEVEGKVSGQREGCVVCDLLQGCYQFVVNAKVR
jgi:hypothetical protein